MEHIPTDIPYLHPDPLRIAQWRDEFGSERAQKVGIAWQGNPANSRDRTRSIPLEHFATLAGAPGARFYSLQTGVGRDQLTRNSGDWPIVDLADRLGDFDNTAAAIANLDLVITCDSAPAHLAGALGIPVWVALAYIPDWRWLLGRDDTVWYPTMRLFRQPRFGDWPAVFQTISAALAEFVSEVPARQRD
jgi:hypothetical protein